MQFIEDHDVDLGIRKVRRMRLCQTCSLCDSGFVQA